MAEVIGTISAVIGTLEACKRVYESARKDIILPKTFVEVARRLPVLQDILKTCHDELQRIGDKLPADVGKAIEDTLDTTNLQARVLRDIFEDTIAGTNDTRLERYKKAIHRVGKGKKVEELMTGITEDARQLADYQVVKSAKPALAGTIEKLMEDLKALEPSVPDGSNGGNTFTTTGGQAFISTGSGKMYVSTGYATQLNYDNMTGTQNIYSGGAQPPPTLAAPKGSKPSP